MADLSFVSEARKLYREYTAGEIRPALRIDIYADAAVVDPASVSGDAGKGPAFQTIHLSLRNAYRLSNSRIISLPAPTGRPTE